MVISDKNIEALHTSVLKSLGHYVIFVLRFEILIVQFMSVWFSLRKMDELIKSCTLCESFFAVIE